MSSVLEVLSPAKLNLFLHITGRADNGYHQLQTIFQLIDLYDKISFDLNHNNQLEVFGLDQVAAAENLIYRAAQALLPYRQSQNLGCHIRLEKHIPMGAGLGGGSSNAGSTLLVLNKLWQCQLSQTQLLAMAASLGADVPVFVYGQNAWAEGIGDQLQLLPQLPKKRFIILKPDCFISTQALFSQKTLTRNAKPSKFAAYQDMPSSFGNNFEPLARQLYPAVEQAFSYLNQYGQAKLTGTGACVFIEIADDRDPTEIVAHSPYPAYVVNSLNQSPVLALINTL
jgi:4-diphosphocytidyl-2-C-methyl-D-erythritol kinase